MIDSTKLSDAAILLIAMQHDLGSMDKVWLPNKAWRDNVLAFARDLIDAALAAAPSAAPGDAREPDWSDSETLPTELWKNPLIPMPERLQIADGAVRFRDRVIANLRNQLAAAPAAPSGAQEVSK